MLHRNLREDRRPSHAGEVRENIFPILRSFRVGLISDWSQWTSTTISLWMGTPQIQPFSFTRTPWRALSPMSRTYMRGGVQSLVRGDLTLEDLPTVM